MLPWPWVLPRKETVVDVLCCRSRFIPQCHRGWMPREIIFIGIKQQGSETQENTWQSHPHSYYNRCMTLPGSSKNNHPHIHGFMELFATPCPPNQCWAHRVYMTAFKKATILVTRVSLCHLLQHWVGGAWGAATALLDVDVVVFLKNPIRYVCQIHAKIWLTHTTLCLYLEKEYIYIYAHIHSILVWISWTWWIRDARVSGGAFFLRPAGPPAAQRPHELRELSSEVRKIVEGGFDDSWCLVFDPSWNER